MMSSSATKPERRRTGNARIGRFAILLSSTGLLFLAWLLAMNVLGYRHLQDQALDMTHQEEYRFSALTHRVLGDLKGEYRIFLVGDPTDARTGRAAEIARSFGANSDRLSVQPINPLRDVQAMASLRAELEGRLREPLAPMMRAIEEARAARHWTAQRLDELERMIADMPDWPPLAASVYWIRSSIDGQKEHPGDISGGGSGGTSGGGENARGFFERRLDAQREAELMRIRGLIYPLGAVSAAAREFADQAGNVEAATSAARAGQLVRLMRQRLESAFTVLRQAEPDERYVAVAQALERPNLLVVLGDEGLHVETVRLDPVEDAGRPGGTWIERVDWVWRIEERLIGGLARLEALRVSPRVILIPSSGSSALRAEGLAGYRLVAERLEALNFEVMEWIPMTRTEDGRIRHWPAPPREPNRTTIWVLLPDLTGFPSEDIVAEPMLGEVLELIDERRMDGDGVMVIARPGQPSEGSGVQAAAVHALSRWLERWGVYVSHREVVVREIQRYQRRSAEHAHVVDRWPTELLVSDALAGLPGRFRWASPIRVMRPQDDSVQFWPLVRLDGPDLGTTMQLRELTRQATGRGVPTTPGDGAFTIAVAAEDRRSRLVVVSDPFWASDASTRSGDGGGAVEQSGDLFPANSELFVNSVCWLAGLEGLVAASPQVQAVIRIGPVDPVQLSR
ncbi:MAG: hypothetical protein JJU36_11515, partial [Phycisphaeraceae bacterium]|nr:hypothetical protein [Phycisphaeraceae bacterium]